MKSPTTKLQHECDKKMQILGKLKFPRSEVSGLPTEVMHHFHPKSVSSALRYDWDNLIPLTNGEHMRHHQANDPIVHGSVIEKRGRVWYDKLLKRRYMETIKVNVAYYKSVKERLDKEMEEFSNEII